MTNGTGFFNPTQFFNGFNPFGYSAQNHWNQNWNQVAPYGIGYPTTPTNYNEFFGGFVPQTGFNQIGINGYQPWNGYAPNWNTPINAFTQGGTPWQNTNTSFNGVPSFGATPTSFYGSQIAQYPVNSGFYPVTNGYNTPVNTTGYGTGGYTTPFNTTGFNTGGFNTGGYNTPFSANFFTPTNITNTGFGFQPWNTSNGFVNTGIPTFGATHTPFVNGGISNGVYGFTPQTNFTPWFNPTANYLSNVAGTPVNTAFNGTVPFGIPTAFHPAFHAVGGIPFNTVNGGGMGIPSIYPVGNTGVVTQNGVTTDVTGKVQNGTIGLARNAA